MYQAQLQGIQTETAPMPLDSRIAEIPAGFVPPNGEHESFASGRSERSHPEPCSVGVMVDLFQSKSAGGHVKAWERLAEAARGEPLDLTVYFFGSRPAERTLSENVRYVHIPPVWNTDSLPFLKRIPAHTDLAPMHPLALWRFRRHQVLHSTGAYFSLARAARMLAHWSPRALVHSTHTDTPSYTRLYADEVVRRLCGNGRLGHTLRRRWRLPERLGRSMQRRYHRYLRSCDWAMAPNEDGVQELREAMPAGRVSILRRGIDREAFHPRHRDRQRLMREMGIPPDRVVLLFVGRVDGGKDVLTLARATRRVLERGLPVHLICAGEGSQMKRVREIVGEQVSLPGQVSQETLSRLYASADLYVSCSRIEIFPNAVLEAKASGVPAVVSSSGGSAKLVRDALWAGEADGVVVGGNEPEAWAAEIEALAAAAGRRRAMGEAARRFIETSWPSWRDVLREDLLPAWRFVARERRMRA
jgi:glycosyltransferase involved in cell wall biosynthesis